MEILIAVLGLGLVALVVFVLKFSKEETKQQKVTEEAKGKKLSDLEAEMARRDVELKKLMDERQKLEDEFFKVKDNIDIFKKENTELTAKLKQLEKGKEEMAELKDSVKQKDLMLQQETVARQKLQGEISLQQIEAEKLAKETEALRQELKTKTEMLDGLKGQYNELESELAKVRQESLKKTKPQAALEPPQEKKPEPIKPEPAVKAEVPLKFPVPEPPKETQEVPGFPKPQETKVEIKQGVPSDTEFLKAQPQKKEEEAPAPSGEIPPGAFKLTNVNKPKDKPKSKRETLVDGFHPKAPPPESESSP